MNDIYYTIKSANLKNYAYDNTLSASVFDLENLRKTLSTASKKGINWFHRNFMQANPHKFKCIFLGPDRKSVNTTLEFQNVPIKSQPYAELLGVTFDDRLSFDKHVSNIAKKAGRQLNALKRIGAFLTERALLNVFKTFSLANLNYCPLVWYFCGAKDTEKKLKSN